jgi:argininosuccinate lyase
MVLGRPIEIAPEVVSRSVDPAQAVQARRSVGGPSPSDMDVMLAGLEQRWRHDRDLVESRKQQLVDAEARLDAAFAKLAAGAS